MAIPPQLKLSHQLTVKALITPLLILNFLLYSVLLGIAGWAYHKNVGGGYFTGANKVTSDLITYTLLAGVVGIASVLSGLHYLRKWSPESKASASATSIVALPLSILSLGIASKYISDGSLHNKKLTTLASFAIIIGVTQLLYTLLVHGIFGEDKLIGHTAPAAAPAAPAATEETPKESAIPATATTTEGALAPEKTGEAAV